MKKLKKILLINWLYFSKELVEIEDINFLTGKNGAGKSTFIDALQIVLLGELNAKNFNKAANESSQRTLDGYLRADMDDKNPKSRHGKDFSSYIACEFCDDIESRYFVIGVVFDCRNDGSRREQFFTYDGRIPENSFLLGKQAMDIAALRTFLKELSKSHYVMYDSNKKYRDDILAKWNVHTDQVFRMLKKAVSFKPIVDIQQFITENICDIPEKPDIEAMQQNIRDYKHHELLAQRQEEKLTALTEISKLFHDMQIIIDRLMQQKFITYWAEKEDIENRILQFEQEKENCQADIEIQSALYKELGEKITCATRRKEQLIADRANSDVYQEESRLKQQKQNLQAEQQNLTNRMCSTALDIKKEAQTVCQLCERIEAWPAGEELLEIRAAASELHRTYFPFVQCTKEYFANSLDQFEEAQTQIRRFADCVQEVSQKINMLLSQLRGEQNQNNKTVSDLKRGVKDYPAGLLSLRTALQNQLRESLKQPAPVDILADVLEIADGEELWRGAVEGYLSTQKFYLLVEPAAYEAALTIFDRLKREYKNAFGLVDIGKLREKERLAPSEDSLAKKVKTQNSLARSYIDYLLGNVICCAHVKQLRQYRTAITAEGMLYQGYVARPISKARMEDMFIGQQAITHRLERLQNRQEITRSQIEHWAPMEEELAHQIQREPLFTLRFINEEIKERQSQYIRTLEISKELEEITNRFSKLNLFWLQEMSTEIDRLGTEIKQMTEKREICSNEKSRFEARIHALEFEVLPEHYQNLTGKVDLLNDTYTNHYKDTIGIPRYKQELARLKKPRIVAKNYGDSIPQTQRALEQAQSKLFAARTDYVRSFQPCAFRVEVMENDEFDVERQVLEESTLPQYREKIRHARESALEQFQNDFLSKIKASIDQVRNQVKNLNRALQQAEFGTDRYQFRVDKNPDYSNYYEMIMAPELMEGESGLFALPFQQKYGALIEDLFSRIATSDDTQLNARKQSELQANIARFTDFRTYLKFDLETTDQNGNRQLLSQTLNTKSGGETQTPFYIAVLASFSQLYKVNDLSSFGNTMRLVIFDEAFNKMDSDRIIESVRLLRKMNLQAIICTPPDKLPDIMPEANRTLLVCKEKYNMRILPYSKELGNTWNETSF